MKDKITILYKDYDEYSYNRVTTYDCNVAYHFIRLLLNNEFCNRYVIYYNNEIVKNTCGFLKFLRLEDKVKIKRWNR